MLSMFKATQRAMQQAAPSNKNTEFWAELLRTTAIDLVKQTESLKQTRDAGGFITTREVDDILSSAKTIVRSMEKIDAEKTQDSSSNPNP